MKTTKFIPKKLAFLWLGIFLCLVVFVVVLWLLLGKHELTIVFTVGFGLLSIILMPLCVKLSANLGTILIDENTVKYYSKVVNNKTIKYCANTIQITDIEEITIVNKAEYEKYEIVSSAKKSLLFNMKGGLNNNADLALFTNKQIEKIIATIEERRKALQNRTT